MVAIGLSFCGAIAGAQDTAQTLASTSGANKFVGSVACQKCHPDMWSNFYNSQAASARRVLEVPQPNAFARQHPPLLAP
jgi:hypothetical protein